LVLLTIVMNVPDSNIVHILAHGALEVHKLLVFNYQFIVKANFAFSAVGWATGRASGL